MFFFFIIPTCILIWYLKPLGWYYSLSNRTSWIEKWFFFNDFFLRFKIILTISIWGYKGILETVSEDLMWIHRKRYSSWGCLYLGPKKRIGRMHAVPKRLFMNASWGDFMFWMLKFWYISTVWNTTYSHTKLYVIHNNIVFAYFILMITNWIIIIMIISLKKKKIYIYFLEIQILCKFLNYYI
jgi:hypothetical protein